MRPRANRIFIRDDLELPVTKELQRQGVPCQKRGMLACIVGKTVQGDCGVGSKSYRRLSASFCSTLCDGIISPTPPRRETSEEIVDLQDFLKLFTFFKKIFNFK